MPHVMSTDVTLPGGVWADGVRHKTAALRPLTGADELFARERVADPSPHRTAALLARCLTRLGPLTEVTPEAVARLTVGDREALAWHLRRQTSGDRVQAVVSCPADGCGERLDLDLRVGDLLAPPYPEHPPARTIRVVESGTTWEVRFRLPTGADLSAVAGVARFDPAAAGERLLAACVLEPAGRLPHTVAEAVATAMADADPQAETRLALTCPACGGAFESVLDAAEFLLAEVNARGGRLLREIHTLARAYHWSEADILGLSPTRRQAYLALVADDAERRGA